MSFNHIITGLLATGGGDRHPWSTSCQFKTLHICHTHLSLSCVDPGERPRHETASPREQTDRTWRDRCLFHHIISSCFHCLRVTSEKFAYKAITRSVLCHETISSMALRRKINRTSSSVGIYRATRYRHPVMREGFCKQGTRALQEQKGKQNPTFIKLRWLH